MSACLPSALAQANRVVQPRSQRNVSPDDDDDDDDMRPAEHASHQHGLSVVRVCVSLCCLSDHAFMKRL